MDDLSLVGKKWFSYELIALNATLKYKYVISPEIIKNININKLLSSTVINHRYFIKNPGLGGRPLNLAIRTNRTIVLIFSLNSNPDIESAFEETDRKAAIGKKINE